MVKKILLVLVCFQSLAIVAKKPIEYGGPTTKVISEIHKPLFRKNTGQCHPDINFRLVSGSSSISFYKNKIQFGLRKQGKEKIKTRTDRGSMAFVVWDLVFKNSNPLCQIVASEQQASRFNQFKAGSDQSQTLIDYGRLTYKNIYPHIDLVFYFGENEALKYDFIVNPGGDFKDIELAYEGLKKIKVLRDGKLSLTTPWGNRIKEDKPLSWQIINGKKLPVEMHYEVKGKTVKYSCSKKVDKNSSLIIDPMMLDWSTYFYGKNVGVSTWGWTYVLDMDIDKNNNVYVTGMTTEAFPTKVGTYDTSMATTFNYEGFVAKMSINADSLLLFTYIGGASYEYILSIAVNSSLEPAISGFTYSNDFPVTSNAYDKSSGSGTGYRGFITKFSKDFKTLIYSTYFGKSSSWGTVIQSMALAANGDLILTGHTNANDFPTTAGCYQSTYGGGAADAFVTRLSADGSKLIYSTYFGGTGDDKATDLSLNSVEDVYVVGSTSNSNFPLTAGAQGVFKYSNSDASDGFVARIQKDGKKLLWSKMMGGTGNDYFEGLYVNSNDELYIGGYSNSGDFYTTSKAFQKYNNGGYDHVVVKMNKSGTNVYYSTYLGGSADDYFYFGYYWNSNIRIAANVKDEPIIGGVTKSKNYPITKDALQDKNKAAGNTWATNLAITKLSYDGSEQLYGTYFGGSYYEYPTVLKVKKISCMSSILYGGISLSKDYPTTKGVYRETGKSGSSWYYTGFLSRFRDTLYTEPIGFKANFVECDEVYEVLDAKNRGADYLWNDGSRGQLLIVTKPGKYWARATYGCDTVSDTINITLEYTPKLNFNPDTILCNSKGITLDAENDTIFRKYFWSTGDTTQTIKAVETGVYSVTVKTPNCGELSDTTEVTFLKKPKITNLKDSVFCDKIDWSLKTDSLGPGTTYQWSTNDSGYSIKVNQVGTYKLKVSNYCGMDSGQTKVSLLKTPKAVLPNDTILCDNFSYKLKVGLKNNEENYFWYDVKTITIYGGKDSLDLKQPGYVAVKIDNRCGISKDSFEVTQRFLPKIDLGRDSIFCDTVLKTISIGTPNNSEIYIWNNNNSGNSQTFTKEGIYWCTIKNPCGLAADTISFLLKKTLKINLGPDTVFCNSVLKNFNITQSDPQTTYVWSDASYSPTFTSNKAEKIWASVKNHCGASSDTIVLSILFNPKVELGVDKVFCDVVSPVSLSVGDTKNQEKYVWSDLSTANTNTLNTTGKHWVRIENICGTVADTIKISTIPSPKVDLGKDTALCGEFAYMLDAGNPGLSYLWEPYGETSQTIIARKQAVYKVSVTSLDGCMGSGSMEVNDQCKSRWYIPNAFTPNGDQLNDEFGPELVNCEKYSLAIYSTWGEKLFESDSPSKKWDGTYKGKMMTDGYYIYIINFMASENKRWTLLKGNIMLVK